MTSYIFDHGDFCRRCNGAGTERYDNGMGSTIIEDCGQCGGTGRRAIRVFPARTQHIQEVEK